MPLPHSSERTGGNPRTCPGSSVVIVGFLLGGVAWYAVMRSARLVVGILGEGAAVASHLCFRRSANVGFVFFFLLFFFFWAWLCCFSPSNGFNVVLCGCYINIAGRKPVSSIQRLIVRGRVDGDGCTVDLSACMLTLNMPIRESYFLIFTVTKMCFLIYGHKDVGCNSSLTYTGTTRSENRTYPKCHFDFQVRVISFIF